MTNFWLLIKVLALLLPVVKSAMDEFDKMNQQQKDAFFADLQSNIHDAIEKAKQTGETKQIDDIIKGGTP